MQAGSNTLVHQKEYKIMAMQTTKMQGEKNLGRNSGTSNEEKATEIPRKSSRQDAKRIVSRPFGDLHQERKQKHVENRKSSLDNLTDRIISEPQYPKNKDLNQNPRPYPHKSEGEIQHEQSSPRRHR